MPVSVVIPESVIQAFPLQERDSLRKLVSLISEAVDTSIGSLTLNDLSDVNAPSPVENEVLTYTDPDWTAEAGASPTSSTYSPILINEINASGTITIIDPWNYTRLGDMVIVQVNVTIDSNASAGDYQVQARIPLPIGTTDLDSICGSVTCRDTSDDSIVFPALVYGGVGGGSSVAGALLDTWFPTNCGVATYKGIFSYRVQA